MKKNVFLLNVHDLFDSQDILVYYIRVRLEHDRKRA